jgi:very-short-patch-repair endonuclease
MIGKKLTLDEFIEKAKKIHGDKYDYSLVEYKNNKSKVKIICPEHGLFIVNPSNHLRGNTCKSCFNSGRRQDFIKNAKMIHGDKYDYSLVEYKNNKSKVKIICPEHGVFEQLPIKHINEKQKCPKCRGYYRSNDEFINLAIKIHGDKYSYHKTKYVGKKEKITVICKTHGDFNVRYYDHLKGVGCSICSISKGEIEVKNWLEYKGIKYIQQHKFDDCKYKNRLPFDFYLPEHNICIEYDGIQHYVIKDFFGGENGFNDIKKRDSIKEKYCEYNKIKLIRVKYDEETIIYLDKIWVSGLC